MDDGAGAGGHEHSGVDRQGLPRQSSAANLSASMSERFSLESLNASRVNALRAIVNRHSDAVAKALLNSKEVFEKKATIEAAFRACRDAFMEVSTVLVNLMEERAAGLTAGDVRKIVGEELDSHRKMILNKHEGGACCTSTCQSSTPIAKPRTYASAVGDARPEIRVSRGPTVEPTKTTSFFVLPVEDRAGELLSSQITKDTLCKVLKPADCGLKINRISFARGNGVRIEAMSPDMDTIKAHPGLAAAGLKVLESSKLNPRIIVHGIPSEMTADEIKNELIAQNLQNTPAKEIKVVYVFKPRPDKRIKSCILEITPYIRKELLNSGRIYLRYTACTLADHVKITQCYRCLTFGHLARECKSEPHCGHCAAAHETKDCKDKDQPPRCYLCERYKFLGDHTHEALDARKCPILGRRIKDKIGNINYE